MITMTMITTTMTTMGTITMAIITMGTTTMTIITVTAGMVITTRRLPSGPPSPSAQR